MSSGDVIFISGATGLFSYGINGPYDRTAESRGGYDVFAKRGDGSVCVEHHDGSWNVRHVSDKGSAQALARVIGYCLLEDCASRVWSVLDMKCYVDQLVTIVSGADAVRQVTPAPPPALATTCSCNHLLLQPPDLATTCSCNHLLLQPPALATTSSCNHLLLQPPALATTCCCNLSFA